jgi:diguanylate cyclase (GGDEF)-like protein
MVGQLLLQEIIYIIIILAASTVFMFAWPRRTTYGGVFFVGHLIALIIWAAGLSGEAASTEAATKIFWSQISYFGVVSVVPFFFLFVLAYTTQKKTKPHIVISLFIIPLIILVGAWTNSLHHLLWPSFHWGSIQYNILIYEHGFLFYVNIVYTYFLVFLGIIQLVRKILSSLPPFRSQLFVILIAILFPIISGLMYVFNIDPVRGMDISVFGFLITNILLTLGFIKYQLLDLVPIARDRLIERFSDGMVVLDWQNRIVEINENTIKLLKLPVKNYLGEQMKSVIPWKIDLLVLSKSKTITEFQLDRTPSVYVELQVSSLAPESDTPPGYLLVLHDNSIRKTVEIALQQANADLNLQIEEVNRLHELLKDQATHDTLTGLYNRRLMDDVLASQLAQAARMNTPFSIAVMDIDHFKTINDLYGHQTGDFFLEEFGKCILASIRKGDFACRLGGDELLIAFPNMDEDIAIKKADELRQKLHEIVIEITPEKVTTSVSIGIATYPVDGQNLTELISSADQALYKAKDKGRNNVQKASTKKSNQPPRVVE